ncbi:aldo/keto reductase [Campylobacter sp. 7477a]|uniref:aldo/keto reductase n=1 Tax=Campylobacter sp. 7477a TaxID=2735741 RepID=UPI0030153417|nr:aldo/keto reductase [Campylobacter sp. 7477a]
MKYTKLGNTDISVSRVCVGCMGFGDKDKGMAWSLPYNESAKIIKYTLEKGINFFDTAMVYSAGTSEEYVGRALNEYAKRDEVVVATKFTPRTQAAIDQGVSGQKFITKCVDDSLKRMGMDYIDLYVYHWWDYHTPMEDIMQGLHEVVKAGKVRAIGISNCYAWQLAKANAYAEANNLTKFASVQGHYNLIFREEEREMVPLCREDNIALTPYSALAAGRLARLGDEKTLRLESDKVANSKYDATAAQDALIIARVAELAKKRGVSMSEISISWLISKTTSPIIGMTKPSNADGAVNAVNLTLTTEEIAYLEEPYVPHSIVGVMANEAMKKPGR